METSQATPLIKELERYCGVFGMEERTEDFIKAFCMMHRTHQQSAFKMILKLMEFIASDQYRTDGRNEQSKKVAQELLAGFKVVNDVAKMYDDKNIQLPSNHLGMI
jgi:hypothetical protein